jgi:hypothetical protein
MHVQFRSGKRGWARKLACSIKVTNKKTLCSIKVVNHKTCTFKKREEQI